MKKTLLFISTLAIGATLSGQLRIAGNNNVGLHTENPLSKVSVGNDGDTRYMFNIYNGLTADYTRGLYVYTVPLAFHRFAVQGSTSTDGGGYAYGLYGSSSSATANGSGRAYGVYGVAGNATAGYNYGTVGRLSGSNNGAGVYGTTSGTDQDTYGRYAGYFYGSVKVDGSLTVSGTLTTSDTSLKKDIKSLEKGAAEKLMRVQALRYKLKNPAELAAARTAHKGAAADTANVPGMSPEMAADFARDRIGLSAQELQAVYPELVVEGQDGALGVDYTGLIPVLIEAIKEQQALIEGLRGEVEKLKKGR